MEQIDEEGRRAVLDLDDESFEGVDVIPGSDSGEEDKHERRRLQALAREADGLQGKEDAKLTRSLELVEKFLADGYAPILFCRFIPTVEYVADFLRTKLEKKGVVIEAITGSLPPEERVRRVDALGAQEQRVLVCTDCLSEGIDLQHHFDAVMHYDLSWNPTRHEQREGRVDRYNQPRDKVRTLTFYGQDNPVDGIVLQVLLRKHKAIHKRLGVIVPVPMETRVIEDAILEGLLMRETTSRQQLNLDFLEPIHKPVDVQWDAAVAREQRSRTLFAQNQMLKAVNTEVRAELAEIRRALGGGSDVRRFTRTALTTLGAVVSGDEPLTANVSETPRALKDAIGYDDRFTAVFSGQSKKGALQLTRTHPVVEGLAAHVLETALDNHLDGPGKRCGVVRTAAVSRRTTVILLRMRFHIVNQGRDGKECPLLAEDLVLVGFTGSPERADWLPPSDVEPLLSANADANIGGGQARNAISRIIDRFDHLRPQLDQVAQEPRRLPVRRPPPRAQGHAERRARTEGRRAQAGRRPRNLRLPAHERSGGGRCGMSRASRQFSAVRTEGGMLPQDLLARIQGGDPNLVGTKAESRAPRADRRGSQPLLEPAGRDVACLPESPREGTGELARHRPHQGPLAAARVPGVRLRSAAQEHRHRVRGQDLRHLSPLAPFPDPPARLSHRPRPPPKGRRRRREVFAARTRAGVSEPLR